MGEEGMGKKEEKKTEKEKERKNEERQESGSIGGIGVE